MASQFSPPFAWTDKLKVSADDARNRLIVEDPTAAGLAATAMYEGFVLYRSTSKPPAPERGDVELVFTPGQWADKLVSFFGGAQWTELPPGRVVYFDVPRPAVESALTGLLTASYETYTKNIDDPLFWHHTVLDHIPLGSKQTLLARIAAGPLDAAARAEKAKAEIAAAINGFFLNSAKDPFYGFRLRKDDRVFELKAATTRIEAEIRNLYGEPLNPLYYLSRLGDTPTELAPTPPFPALAPGGPPSARRSAAGAPLQVRTPRTGGAQFAHRKDKPRYTWEYVYNPVIGSYQINILGAPAPMLPNAGREVQNIWQAYYPIINKYAALFQVPCELVVATIYVESLPDAAGFADPHSIHFEPLQLSAPYPVDFEGLRNAGVPDADARNLWRAVGGLATHPRGLLVDQPLKRKETPATISPAATLKPPNFEFTMKASVGKNGPLQRLTWQQLEPIINALPDRFTTLPGAVRLPALQDRGGKLDFDLIRAHPGLGADSEAVARMYWAHAGGVGRKAGKAQATPDAKQVLTAPLPLRPGLPIASLTDPDDPTGARMMSWGQLIQVLSVIPSKGGSLAEQIRYTVHPLRSLGSYDLTAAADVRRQLMAELHIDETDASDILVRYRKLESQSLRYVPPAVPPPGGDQVEDINHPGPDRYLTLAEARAVSKIFPHRISIGLGQVLLDTIATRIAPWVRQHYGAPFFTDQFGPDGDPPANSPACATWSWDHVWSDVRFQIALVAAYVRRNAAVYWRQHGPYRVGERMTMFDFPRIAAAYNAGQIEAPKDGNSDADWGLHTTGNYFPRMCAALVAAVQLFAAIPAGDPTAPAVRLRPDLESGSGMDPR